jgi:TIR domain
LADVFLSYVSEERPRAQLLAEGLAAEGFSVWWDPHLEPGEVYSQVIDREIKAAKVVVVLWSHQSVQSYWVCSEATVGFQRGTLVPVRIDDCDVPTGFVLVQYVDIVNWAGDRGAAAWQKFVAAVTKRRAGKQTGHIQSGSGAASQASIELVYWDTVRGSKDPADYQAYVSRYPNGAFVDLARNRVALLSPGVSDALEPRPGRRGLLAQAALAGALLAAGLGYLLDVSRETVCDVFAARAGIESEDQQCRQ